MVKISFVPFGVLILLFLCMGISRADASEAFETRIMLIPERKTVLSSLISGQILQISVGEGDRFQKGDVLAEMDCDILKFRMKKAEINVSAAEHTLHVRRFLETRKSGSALESKLAETELNKARAEFEETRETVERCHLKAPFDGLVVELKVDAHQSVAQNEPMLSILDDSSLEARMVIPALWLEWLRVGTPFLFQIDGSSQKRYQAVVSHIIAQIDGASQTLPIRGRIVEIDPDLVAGMSGSAYFQPASP